MAGGSIELAGLCKRFGEHIAVDNIDLSVASGEFFSLLGPSGCGKTTTLRLIAGFEQPTAGRVLLDGLDVSAVPAHKRNVNTVFQSYALFPFLSVFDNVAFGLRYARVTKAELRTRVGDALSLVSMSSFASRRPGQLPGAPRGERRHRHERQRVPYPGPQLGLGHPRVPQPNATLSNTDRNGNSA